MEHNQTTQFRSASAGLGRDARSCGEQSNNLATSVDGGTRTQHNASSRCNSGAHLDLISQINMDVSHHKHQHQHRTNSNSTDNNSKQQQRVVECGQQEETERMRRLVAANRKEKKPKAHFRIDWRQLTYYQGRRSLLAKCLASCQGVFGTPADKQQQQQQSGAALDDVRSEASSFATAAEAAASAKSSSAPKRILNSLDGCFKSGELSAILGPSGAGKSTFLSTLFGSKQEQAYGYTKVTWLDESHTKNPREDDDDASLLTTSSKAERQRSLRIASLPQHDHLLHHLTVYETLMFASKIKNHENVERSTTTTTTTTREGKEKRSSSSKRSDFHHLNVKRVAKMLKLTECLNTRCGKLSGGQYKRVSIGQELLSEPDVIILDEPTSGLDSMTCLTTIQTLKSIVTKHPMSIILTIHQPDNDVFALFDKIYVIAQGGMAIYEGPPEGIFPALAEVNMFPPRPNYNPARFIVENAFVPEPGAQDHLSTALDALSSTTGDDDTTVRSSSSSSSSDDEDDDHDDNRTSGTDKNPEQANYFKRSMQSLTGTILGKETPFNKRDTIRRPLLNIGIRTLDGQLITSDQLAGLEERNAFCRQQEEKLRLLRRLNQAQKAKYEKSAFREGSCSDETSLSKQTTDRHHSESSGRNSCAVSSPSPRSAVSSTNQKELSSAKSDYSSASACSIAAIDEQRSTTRPPRDNPTIVGGGAQSKSISLVCLPGAFEAPKSIAPTQKANGKGGGLLQIGSEAAAAAQRDEFVVDLPATADNLMLHHESPAKKASKVRRRKFDKRLSAKHNCSQQTGNPILYHALLLTHRTWLSIVRDPVFFGIQACMHTLIPIVLATIFGSVQEEGCPRIGSFDLVDFAYSDSENLIQGTMRSIRGSIGNIGIVFFEMFVICFAINCITALVFPLDMFVLLKEYRNGWYSLRSYFMGRTLADLPVPVVLHSIGMAILYFMTGQPHSLWRFSSIVLLVILASLVAQSVGLTIGALLMKSSQSAVLAAAGIVAPFFALSGFIVRIHTLPAIAQLAANASYLYHLLNGFIVLRYGFGRCQCNEEDLVGNSAHQIPNNLHTMASMWIGTYSEEYANSSSVVMASAAGHHNRTRSNVDPNIDVVDKMMTAFKMANSYGHTIENCDDVLPYAMLDFNQRDQDIYYCFLALLVMLLISRLITFSAIYYKIRSFA